jgi:hypothetical protein
MLLRTAVGLILVMAMLHPLVARAQSYRCTEGGRLVVSDRPCLPGASTRLGAIGPIAEQPRSTAYKRDYSPPMQRAAEHVGLLSPRCATISEAIRTGPARGVRGEVISDLRTEYRNLCADEEQLALGKLSDKRQNEREKKHAELVAQDQDRAQRQRVQENCVGMRDAIQGRKKRLNPELASEVAALADVERRFDEQCRNR